MKEVYKKYRAIFVLGLVFFALAVTLTPKSFLTAALSGEDKSFVFFFIIGVVSGLGLFFAVNKFIKKSKPSLRKEEKKITLKGSKNLSVVEHAFDFLSSIPLMKNLMIAGWVVVAIVRGVRFWMAYTQGMWGEHRSATTKALIIFCIGHTIIAYFLYFWHKFDRQKEVAQ